MYLIRPVKLFDLPQLQELCKHAGPGLTSLPKTAKLLEKKILCSLETFKSQPPPFQEPLFLFVLEEQKQKKLVGCCGILAQIGLSSPSVFYKIEVQNEQSYLTTVEETGHPSEICSLYLIKELRKEGLGKPLSFSRFLFIADFKQFFEKRITAEMRGFIDQAGNSPFWDGLKQFFENIDFFTAHQKIQNDKNAIRDFIINAPLPLNSFPKEAILAMGKTHPNTLPALQLLIKQGFSLTGEFDLLDGGPRISADTFSLESVQHSQIAKIAKIQKLPKTYPLALISNQQLRDFKACIGQLLMLKEGEIALSLETTKMLEVDVGSFIRFIWI